MQFLLASVLVVCVAAGAQAQYAAWSYGVPSHLLPTAPVMTVKEPVMVKSVVPSIYPYVVQVSIPNQDTSRGLPQPVDDTPEVKSAKAVFAKEYEKAAIAAALTPEMPVHAVMPEVHRRRRDLSSVMHMRTPVQLQMPVNPYMGQYNWMAGQHMMTTPHMYYV